jgi:hypothetical protein
MRPPAHLLVVATLTIAAAACSRLSVENYDRLKIGMRYDEVKALLGAPSKCSDLLTIKSCTWGDEKRYVQVSFVADQVVLFNSENLR